MPLPEALQRIITPLADKFVPNAARREYFDNRPIWRLYLDLYELDGAKLAGLIEKHVDEDPEKYQFRQKLAAVFNYVPMVVRMTINYIYSEQPRITADDAGLQRFIQNCDGSGLPLAQFVRQTVMPLSLTLGFLDVLVQNPATPEGMFVTGADDVDNAAEVTPRVLPVTPLYRFNWSTKQTGEYQWIAFIDLDAEEANPFIPGIPLDPSAEDKKPEGEAAPANANAVPFAGQSFIRISQYLRLEGNTPNQLVDLRDDAGRAVGFWVRSWQELDDDKKARWYHDGGWLPTARVPVATLYYSRSIDPMRRHHGISKIAMIAVLTKKIIQLLSWTDEDVVANLAIFVFPGNPPKDKDNNVLPVKLTPFGILYMGADAKFPATMLQGATSHIEIKMRLIDSYIREILRLAYILGVSAEAERINSGVQGIVARNELFMELSDIAGALDTFTLDLLALAKSWETNQDISRATLIQQYKPAVSFYKGPYAVDPLGDVITNTEKLIRLFEQLSPTMMQSLYKQLAMAALSNEDAARDQVFSEIDQNFRAMLAERAQQRSALMDSLGAAGGADETETNTNQPENNAEIGSGTSPGGVAGDSAGV